MNHQQVVLRHVVRHLKEHAPYLDRDEEYKAASEKLLAEEEEPREEPPESKKGR